MPSKKKLFRAIVLMGAAITAGGCENDKCAKCAPPTDAVATQDVNTSQHNDAGVDAMTDAFIAIL
ncbi:MAG TPA: hypothetical protein VL326_33250 [Kofleriaceae bacterium]|nr:hypothetical protein [Kofleriaceae bacterium]